MIPASPRTISRLSGDVSSDGQSIVIRIEANNEINDFSASRADIAGLVHMLLTLGNAASDADLKATIRAGDWPPHLPVSSVSIGETLNGDSALIIEVPATTFVFRLSLSELGALGRVLLTFSAETHSKL